MGMRKKALKTVVLGACPMCRKKLNEHDVTVVERGDTATLCTISCVTCKSSLLFTVSSHEHSAVATAGILADIADNDIELIRKNAPVRYDDALAMHTYLENKSAPKKE